MKRKLFISFLGATLSIATLSSVAFYFKSTNNAPLKATYQGEIANSSNKTIYYIDEEINIEPQDIIYENTKYICTDFYLKFPDGSQKSGSKFKLSQNGEYEIVYIAKVNGKVIEAKEKIYAYSKAYNVKKESSSTQYVDSIICSEEKVGGIQTYLVDGDTWTYNQTIDISSSDLNTPIIKYFTRQSSELANHVSIDVSSVVVRLTDFYDQTNYIDIYNTYYETNPSTHRMQPYMKAAAPGQTLSGIDLTNKSSKIISYQGTNYYLHTNTWGSCLDTYPGTYGINGDHYNPDIANSDNVGFSIYYDYQTKAIYCKHKNMHLVTDLDEPAIYSNTLFKGFTTGEVILSVFCQSYQEDSGFFEISEIYGKTGADLNSSYAYDDKAPIITLDNNANNFNISLNEPFNIFHATASDPNLIGEVIAQVYYDYGTDNQRFVPLKNGAFTPSYVGKYTIVYTAKDTYGNVTTKTVTCQAITTKNNKIVDLDFDVISSADAGSYVNLSTPVLEGYNDGLFYDITAVNKTTSDVSEVDDSLTLFLKYAGEYIVTIKYGDVASTYYKEYKLTANPSSNVYLETKNFPKYFIKDASFSLDNNRLVLCSKAEPTYAIADIYIKNDNHDYETTPIDYKEFKIEASNCVQFKYVYQDEIIYETEPIPVYDVDFGNDYRFQDYFAGDLTTALNSDGVTFSANKVGELTSTFINPLSFNLLRCEVLFNNTTDFKTLDLIMEDYYGENNSLVINFFYNGTVLYYMINGTKGEIGNVDNFALSYDPLNSALSFGNGVSITLDNPFSNDRIYLRLRLTDVDSAGESPIFTVKQINNQLLNKDMTGGDFTPGQISYTRLKGQRNINTIITINKSTCSDTLSPYLINNHTLKVTYKANANDAETSAVVVKALDGTLLDGKQDVNKDYEVLLDKHGVYRITYSFVDQADNRVGFAETIYVEDNEAPEISIIGGDNIASASINKEIKVRDYTINDESEVEVSLYAVSPSNHMVRIEDNRKFKPDEKGDWHIIYYAIDANYNVSMASYILRVK